MKISRQLFPTRSFIVNALLLGLISFLPLVLFLRPGWQFGSDWLPNVWLVAYFGEFFKSHLCFPEVINTEQLSGMPFPVFYGFLAYPFLGLLRLGMEPAIAVRVAIAAVFLLQSWQVFRLLFQISGDRILGFVVAAVTCWSTYALTNLYNRGAVMELIAVALLTSAICSLCRACLLPPDRRRWPDVAIGMLFFVFAAGTHAITALFGGLFVAFLLFTLLTFAERRLELVRWLAIGGVAAFLVLSPWAYAVLKFGSSLQVSKVHLKEITYLSIDTAASRLMPIPYDIRVAKNPKLPADRTPFLDAQITAGLLILALFFSDSAFFMYRRGAPLNRAGVWLTFLFWALFLFLFALSVTPALGAAMPALFHNLQFAYRLVSYLNLCLLIIITGSLAATPGAELTLPLAMRRGWVLAVTLGVAVLGLAIKLGHGTASTFPAPAFTGAQALYLPPAFYGSNDYAIIESPLSSVSTGSILRLPVGRASSYGLVRSAKFQCEKSEYVRICVQPFPWNEVWVNGRSAISNGALQSASGIIVPLEAGQHEIKYTWRPARTWVWLNRISRGTLLIWIGFVLALSTRSLRRDLMSRLASALSPARDT
jgi:hypothetical protein